MKPRRVLAIAAAVLAVAAGSPMQVEAQGFWPFDALFGRKKEPQAAPPNGQASPRDPSGGGASGPGSMPPTAILPPRRPASLPHEGASRPPALPREAAPRPPAPPQQAQPAQRTAPEPPPTATAAAPLLPAAPPTVPAGPDQIIERANAYFNGIGSLVGDFVQIGGDGRRLSGKLYLQRPGKLRFEYDAPATIEVISDGSAVAVRDRRLATQDIYPISQTPLKFLLSDRIDLGRDLKLTEAANENDGARIGLEDKSTLGGTSRITLYFDKTLTALTRWRIIDPQGYQTTVSLANLDRSRRVDQRLFVISYERLDDAR
jgi:outer membrane lipoprotein-sorting protein